MRFGSAAILAGMLFVLAGPAQGQAPAKRPLTHRDYDIWNTTTGMSLAKNGQWLAYHQLPADGDGAVVIRNLANGTETRIPRGRPAQAEGETPSGPPAATKRLPTASVGGGTSFSPDVKKLFFPLSPTRGEMEKAKAAKVKPEEMPQPALAVFDLATSKVVDRIPQVKGYTLGGTGAGFLIYQKQAKSEETPAPPSNTPPGSKRGTGTGRPGVSEKGAAPVAARPVPSFGTDLVVRDLATGKERTLAEVADYTLAKDGKTLVYTVSSRKPETNGVFAIDPALPERSPTVLRSGRGKYSRLTWDEKQSRLAFFGDELAVAPLAANVAPAPRAVKETPKQGKETPTQATTPVGPTKWRVFVWDRGTQPAAVAASRISPAGLLPFSQVANVGIAVSATPTAAAEVLTPDTPGQRTGWAVVDRGGLSFSTDGSKLFVSTAPVPEPSPARPTAPTGSPARPVDEGVALDIWHWKDAYIQPMQKVRAESERSKSYRAVVLLDGDKTFRQLADEAADVASPPVGDWALGSDDRPYRHLTGYGPNLRDVSLVNIRNGEKKPLFRASGSAVTPSPDGKHALAFDGKNWLAFTVPGGQKTNLTAKLPVKFFNEEWDSPSEPPPYGMAGWTKDGAAVLLRDRFDIWKVPVDGSPATNLTKIGRRSNLEFRIVRLNTDEEADGDDRKGVDLNKPLLLAAENQHTRDTGFFRLLPGQEPKMLLMGARKYGDPVKAKNAETYLLTASTFADVPDYYVCGPDFHELRKVTDLNPRKNEFLWGKAELVHYKSADGLPLSGILIKPENFDPNKKYPMVVYIYERLSENLHNFRLPAAGTSINPTFYASNGYLVLMPDIAYTVGSPGQSALKCVLPAIQAVVDQGSVNEAAIGIQGHSWGGYQISYLVTQTNRFKAAAAGAPVSNMVSAYGGIRWGTGLPREFQYERTQSRIGGTLWQVPLKFIENSPVFMADRVKTPLMILHNDQDDAVPWYQGIEYYLALRRLEKEVYLLNYNGELHGLRRKANQRDYTLRMQQFFDHHLKGAPAPEWMTKGVPYRDRDKEKLPLKELFVPQKK